MGAGHLCDKTNPIRKTNNPPKKSKPSIANCRPPTKVQTLGITNKMSKPTTRPKIAVKPPPIRKIVPVSFIGLWIIAMVHLLLLPNIG